MCEDISRELFWDLVCTDIQEQNMINKTSILIHDSEFAASPGKRHPSVVRRRDVVGGIGDRRSLSVDLFGSVIALLEMPEKQGSTVRGAQ